MPLGSSQRGEGRSKVRAAGPEEGEHRAGRNATKVEVCTWAPEVSANNFGINA